jgi:hypothetical protein
MSATVLLSIQSLVLSARTTAGLLTPARLDAEAAVLLDRYLSPAADTAAAADPGAAADQAAAADPGAAEEAGVAAGSGAVGASQDGPA